MRSDGIVSSMRMEDYDILVLDRLCVAGRVNGCHVIIGSGVESISGRRDKEGGNIRKESRESDERNYSDHDESGETKKNKKNEMGCWLLLRKGREESTREGWEGFVGGGVDDESFRGNECNRDDVSI